MRFIDGPTFRSAVSVGAAVEALAGAFRDLRLYSWPQRTVVPIERADLLLMPSSGEAGAGVKLVTVNPDNVERDEPLIHAVYVLFSPGTLAPVAVIDGEALTGLRTGALSALATRLLAKPDASHLVVFGAGAQARAHIEAISAVRPIERVTVVSRTRARAEALAEAMRRRDLEISVGRPDSVATADVVCTCTTSPTPVFPGDLLPEGAHVNAIGAYRPDARETDDALVRRARLVVETKDSALAEAGDVAIPLSEGVIEEAAIVELSQVVRGEVVVPREETTLFKAVGMAVEDLVVAREALGEGGLTDVC